METADSALAHYLLTASQKGIFTALKSQVIRTTLKIIASAITAQNRRASFGLSAIEARQIALPRPRRRMIPRGYAPSPASGGNALAASRAVGDLRFLVCV